MHDIATTMTDDAVVLELLNGSNDATSSDMMCSLVCLLSLERKKIVMHQSTNLMTAHVKMSMTQAKQPHHQLESAFCLLSLEFVPIVYPILIKMKRTIKDELELNILGHERT